MKKRYLARIVNLTSDDYITVRRFADDKGLGSRGFSAALRMIIREWDAYTASQPPHPLHRPAPPAQD